MKNNFQKLMTKKSDSELEEYLINIMAYSREIVEAAIIELKNRGRIFTESEFKPLNQRYRKGKTQLGKIQLLLLTCSKRKSNLMKTKGNS